MDVTTQLAWCQDNRAETWVNPERFAFLRSLNCYTLQFTPINSDTILGDFIAKVGRENIFKPTTGNESLHQDSNDNVVRIVNFAT
jgi:hypothetical protein